MRKAPKHASKKEKHMTVGGNRRNLILPFCITVFALSVLGALFLFFPKNHQSKIPELPDVTFSESEVITPSADTEIEETSVLPEAIRFAEEFEIDPKAVMFHI